MTGRMLAALLALALPLAGAPGTAAAQDGPAPAVVQAFIADMQGANDIYQQFGLVAGALNRASVGFEQATAGEVEWDAALRDARAVHRVAASQLAGLEAEAGAIRIRRLGTAHDAVSMRIEELIGERMPRDLAAMLDLLEREIAAAEARDAGALKALDAEWAALVDALIEVETALYEARLLVIDPTHPDNPLTRSMIAANGALRALNGLVDGDASAAIAALTAHAGEMRAAAGELLALLPEVEPRLVAIAAGGATGLTSGDIPKVIASYRASARIEVLLAEHFETVAARLGRDAGAQAHLDALKAAEGRTSELTDLRQEQILLRIRLLAGQAG